MSRYYPEGYMSPAEAIYQVVTKKDPVLWDRAGMPPEEVESWRSVIRRHEINKLDQLLGGYLPGHEAFLTAYSRTALYEPEDIFRAETARRYRQFIAGLHLVLDALMEGGLVARYEDEEGKLSAIPRRVWGYGSDAEPLYTGTIELELGPARAWDAFVLFNESEIERLWTAGRTSSEFTSHGSGTKDEAQSVSRSIPSAANLKAFLRKRYLEWPLEIPLPSVEADIQAADEKWPNVSRDSVRLAKNAVLAEPEFPKDIARLLTKPGPRPALAVFRGK